MAAQDHLNRHQFRVPDELYHGTNEILHIGDLIMPRNRLRGLDTKESNYPDKTQDIAGTHVFATGDLMEAYYHAANAANVSGVPDEYNRPPARAVYMVKPTGRMIRDREIEPEDFNDSEGRTSWQSRQPLRVVGNVSWEARREWMDNIGEDIKNEHD